MIRTLAAKISPTTECIQNPQQSDYVAKWLDSDNKKHIDNKKQRHNLTKTVLKSLYSLCPLQLRYSIDEYRGRFNLSNRKFFVPWEGQV